MIIQTPALPRHIAPLAAFVLITALASGAALAAPPATVATCQGITDAYPVLGAQCTNAYAKVSHNPGNATERAAAFRARIPVLQIFRKALLCNGMYGASSAAQRNFKAGEDGHIAALANLRAAMTNAGDANIPAAYTADDLRDSAINKQQCK